LRIAASPGWVPPSPAIDPRLATYRYGYADHVCRCAAAQIGHQLVRRTPGLPAAADANASSRPVSCDRDSPRPWLPIHVLALLHGGTVRASRSRLPCIVASRLLSHARCRLRARPTTCSFCDCTSAASVFCRSRSPPAGDCW
jgi:hypothetical protein